MRKLVALWRGDWPLPVAFWQGAVLGGLAVNLSTTILFLVLIALDRPFAALFVGYALSVPYNVLVTVGVWRAAGRQGVPQGLARLARGVTVAGMVVLSLT